MIDVSIVVCTRNRAPALQRCLASIAEATLRCPEANAELVIVDNGSSDNTHDVVATWRQSAPLPVRFVEEYRAGAGAARNAGVMNASGKLIAFTDDDCRLSPTFLSDVMRHFRRDEIPVIRTGRVELGDPTDDPLATKINKTEYHFKYPLHPGDMGLGCNMVVPAEIFALVGSFDVRFGPGAPFKAGEETEFFWRAHLCKVPIIYVPDMVVYHFHGRKNRDVVANYIVSNGALYAKHLSTLHRHLYWDLRKVRREPRMVLLLFKGMALFWGCSWCPTERDRELFKVEGARWPTPSR
jgi:glycosyltransferase involved in cell wall biosynthesis